MEAPRLIEGLSHEVIVSAACGRNHTLALTGKGWLVSVVVTVARGQMVLFGWGRGE